MVSKKAAALSILPLLLLMSGILLYAKWQEGVQPAPAGQITNSTVK
jgi:hypothetical protein